jgi:hypothetical protein
VIDTSPAGPWDPSPGGGTASSGDAHGNHDLLLPERDVAVGVLLTYLDGAAMGAGINTCDIPHSARLAGGATHGGEMHSGAGLVTTTGRPCSACVMEGGFGPGNGSCTLGAALDELQELQLRLSSLLSTHA